MTLTASTFVLAVVLSSAGASAPAVIDAPVFTPAPAAQPLAAPATIATPRWMQDRPITRPRSISVMYGTLGVLQALDVYSTRRAISAGARELNPAMREPAGASGTMLAVKALSSAGTIYFAERAWKKNRSGAVVLMAVLNGVTAAVVAHNMRQVR